MWQANLGAVPNPDWLTKGQRINRVLRSLPWRGEWKRKKKRGTFQKYASKMNGRSPKAMAYNFNSWKVQRQTRPTGLVILCYHYHHSFFKIKTAPANCLASVWSWQQLHRETQEHLRMLKAKRMHRRREKRIPANEVRGEPSQLNCTLRVAKVLAQTVRLFIIARLLCWHSGQHTEPRARLWVREPSWQNI